VKQFMGRFFVLAFHSGLCLAAFFAAASKCIHPGRPDAGLVPLILCVLLVPMDFALPSSRRRWLHNPVGGAALGIGSG